VRGPRSLETRIPRALEWPCGQNGDTLPGGDHGKIDEVTTRVFVLDDHELVRTGLRSLLEDEEDMVVVGEAATAQEGIAEIGATQPDVAILDVRLPDGSGIEVCREIRSLFPAIACLMLTSYSDDEALFAAIMAGAAGYVLKEVGGRDLVGDIRRVSQGESLLDPVLTEEVFDRLRKNEKDEARLGSLTAQERRILDLIAQGRSNRQIAGEMYLAEKTVKNYVSSLLSKLGMQRRTEAGVYAAILAERRSVHSKGAVPLDS
jgi:two-component system response regulator DevR